VPTATDVQGAIRARTRLEIGDYAENFSVNTTADGTSAMYELGYQVITNVTVAFNGSNQNQNTYTLDAQRGTILFNSIPASGTQIAAFGQHNQFFPDAELDLYIRSAFLKHTTGFEISSYNVDSFGHHQMAKVSQDLVSLPEVQWHMVALLAAAESLEILLSDATYDIDVQTPEGVSLPRSERESAIQELADRKLTKYKELGAFLNVGFYRVRMGSLRRRSLTTGRLTPVYAEREFDDNEPPQRIIAHIDLPVDLQQPDDGVFSQDLIIPAGTGLSETFTTGTDLSAATAVIATMTTGGYTTSIVTLTVVVVNAATGEVTVTIPYSLAQTLPAYAPWRLVATQPDGTAPVIATGTVVQQETP
jgi:hypothetical protein